MKNKLKKYRLEQTKLDSSWDTFVLSSPQSNIYCTSQYLLALQVKFHAYYCYKANELMAAVIALISNDEQDIIEHGLVVHDGLLFRDLSHLNQAQQHSEEFAIHTFIVEVLADKYRNITLNLHPSIVDIRPALWVNYHNNGQMFVPDIKYTSIINISDFNQSTTLDDINLYKQASVARRQEIRYAKKKGVTVRSSVDVKKLVYLYQETMARQEIEITNKALDFQLNFMQKLLDQNLAVLFEAVTAQGQVGSMALFLLDNNTAHFLYGANDPTMRNQHTGTAVLWGSFYSLASLRITNINLEGINSPQRGWFKLSFGGSIIPYYQIKLTRTPC